MSRIHDLLGGGGSLLAFCLLALDLCAAPAVKPNILFFFVDDMGWQETSVPFHTEVTELNRRYQTPNMERLAARGMKFRQAYACAVCSPSRISLMTGMNAARHMVTNWTLRKNVQADHRHRFVRAAAWNVNGMSATVGVERTVHAVPLPMLLKKAGYRTIHCGKAHFGAAGTPGADPCTLGFDINIAGHAAGGPGSYWGKYNYSAAWRKGSRIWDVPGLEAYHGEENLYLNEALTREAIKAVDQAVADGVPFYLYMSHYAIHAPWEQDERFYQKYIDAGLKGLPATYASMVESMDRSLGDLVACLKRHAIDDRTVVVFMSDNGQPKQAPRNRPLRGHKLTPYEGGVRVPMIVAWPGVVTAGLVCEDRYVIIEDIFPTFLEIAGVRDYAQIGGRIDGLSFVPLLRGSKAYPADRPVFWHYPNTYDQPPYSSVRKGDWKLIYHHVTRTLELFNLKDDIAERRDVASTAREKTHELAAVLSDFLRESEARMTVDVARGTPVEYPDQVIAGRGMRPGARVPDSAIAANLQWVGVAVAEPEYTIWGAAPIEGADGRIHLFVARWPEANVDPAWRKSSEIAHYVGQRPEGPFRFKEVVLTGTGRTGAWDAYAPHNPEIKKVGDTYALLYIANSDYHQPPHPYNQSIGMVVSQSLNGPWRKVGADGLILDDSPSPTHWTHGMQVVNPTLIQHEGKFLLYFKSRKRGRSGSVYAVAVADRLEGPYRLPDAPLTSHDVTIEDGSVFAWEDKICLLTTDNHGQVTGIRGGGVLWVSDDGMRFNPAWTQVGYDRIPAYLRGYDRSKIRRVYGRAAKLERPKILLRNGRPAYLYAPSGWTVHGGRRTACYVLRIVLPEGAGPITVTRE